MLTQQQQFTEHQECWNGSSVRYAYHGVLQLCVTVM